MTSKNKDNKRAKKSKPTKQGIEIIEKSITISELLKRLEVLDPKMLVSVHIKEAKKEQKEKTLQSLLNFKPLKGINPTSVIEILREIRENE